MPESLRKICGGLSGVGLGRVVKANFRVSFKSKKLNLDYQQKTEPKNWGGGG